MPPNKRSNSASADESDLGSPRGSLTSLGEGRLSRISINTKYAAALNQIDRIDISDTYDRIEDGVTMYVLDIYLLCVQTGIPTSSRGQPPKSQHKWFGHKDSKEAESIGPGGDDPHLRKRERERDPHYHVAYRFSEFYQLRKDLKEIVDEPDETLHSKWCPYCGRLDWLVNDTPFPSRYIPLLDVLILKISWLKKWRVKRRQRKLAGFLKELVHGIRTMQYRFSGEQCDGFVNTTFVLKEFLSEPHMRQSYVW